MTHDIVAEKSESTSRLLVPSLISLSLAIAISNVLLNFLSVDIATSFRVNEGFVAQLRTANALGEVIFGLLIGILATRLRHKHLLLIGALLISISAIGNFVAFSFGMMLFFFFIEGAGSIIVAVLSFSIIGDSLIPNRKMRAVSFVTSGGFAVGLFGPPLIIYSANLFSWRPLFLLLVLPVSIIALALASLGAPNRKILFHESKVSWERIAFRNIKQLLSKRSTVSYLIGTLFFTGPNCALFVVAFLRQQLNVETNTIVYISVVGGVFLIFGCLFAGRVGNRVSAKSLTLIGSFGSGVLILLLFFATSLWAVLFCQFAQLWFSGITITSYVCLGLEQTPSFRHSMMSLTRFFGGIGNFIAPALGGLLLTVLAYQSLWIGYKAVGVVYGGFNLIAVAFYLLVKNPKQGENLPPH